MAEFDSETVKEIVKTIRVLDTSRNWIAGIVIALFILTILVVMCLCNSYKRQNTENKPFCSAKTDTIYVLPMQLKVYQDSGQILGIGGSR